MKGDWKGGGGWYYLEGEQLNDVFANNVADKQAENVGVVFFLGFDGFLKRWLELTLFSGMVTVVGLGIVAWVGEGVLHCFRQIQRKEFCFAWLASVYIEEDSNESN